MSIHLDDLGPTAEQRERSAEESFKEWQRVLVLKCAIAEELALQEEDND